MKITFTIIIIFHVLFINAQNKGCGHPAVSSDHGGYCSSDTRLIDTAYFNVGDTVFFTYGTSGSTCDYVSSNQIYFNGNAISTPPSANTWSYFNTTASGTYRFEWYQNIFWDFTIELISNTPNSIEIFDKNNQINIYPNPSSERFTVELDDNLNEQALIEVFDITGNLISQNIINGHSLSIDLYPHPKGIYVVKLNNGNQIFTRKLIYQ